MRQDRLPASHARVHRRAQPTRILCEDGIIAILARLPQPQDPLRIEVLDAEGAIAGRALRHRHHPDDLLQPARHVRVVVRLDMCGEVAALMAEVVVQPIDAGVDQPDHVLRAGRFRQARVLGCIELPHQDCGITGGQSSAPQPLGDPARAGAHAAAIHEADGRFQRHHDHRPGRGGVQLGDERLIDPAAGEGHAVGHAADDVSDLHCAIPRNAEVRTQTERRCSAFCLLTSAFS